MLVYCTGALMVRTPSLDKEEEILSGLTECGNVKDLDSVWCRLFASTITLLSTVLMTS